MSRNFGFAPRADSRTTKVGNLAVRSAPLISGDAASRLICRPPCREMYCGDLCFAMAALVGHECRYWQMSQNHLHTDTFAVALNDAPGKKVAPVCLIYCRLWPW